MPPLEHQSSGAESVCLGHKNCDNDLGYGVDHSESVPYGKPLPEKWEFFGDAQQQNFVKALVGFHCQLLGPKNRFVEVSNLCRLPDKAPKDQDK